MNIFTKLKTAYDDAWKVKKLKIYLKYPNFIVNHNALEAILQLRRFRSKLLLYVFSIFYNLRLLNSRIQWSSSKAYRLLNTKQAW